MSIINSNLLLGASAGGGSGNGYEISRSLRFNSSDSAFCSRTPASAGNRKTWTWAGWVKKPRTGTNTGLFNGGASATNYTSIYLDSGDLLIIESKTASVFKLFAQTVAVLRDPSAWYHVVVSVDTTQAVSANGVKVYVNGLQQLLTISTYTQNDDTFVGQATEQRVGYTQRGPYYSDVYLADVHLVDGQALDPTSFGESSATTGVWMPKAYTGTYGTNGFKLDFSDNSAATATTLGKDSSGNGNNWTPNNLSVTAGAGNDSLVDVPTNGSEVDTGLGAQVRGNYCTWNPLDKDADVTLTNGNLDMTQTAAGAVKGTIAVSTGKWYWEINKTTTDNQCFGIATAESTPTTYIGGWFNSAGFSSAGTLYSSGSVFSKATTDSVPLSSGDVLGFALDLDGGTLKIYRNGILQTANHFIIANAGLVVPTIGTNAGDYVNPSSANFGQRPFAYTAPSGFKALCTANLPAPTIVKPSTVMDTLLWTGNSATRTLTGLNFDPDLIWVKIRSDAKNHVIQDSIRGFSTAKKLSSSGDFVEGDAGNLPDWAGYISGTSSTGFSLDKSGTGSDDWVHVNKSGNTYVGWAWDAGSSTVTNTQGSITSSCRMNASAGVSIVSWTGGGVDGTVGHGLNVTPKMYIYKNRSAASNWGVCYTVVDGSLDFMFLNSTASAGNATQSLPTSSVLSMRVNAGDVISGNSYIAYVFAPVAGYSSFGSYIGNGGSTQGRFIYTGFRTKWIVVKSSSSGNNTSWNIFDSSRNPYNLSDVILSPNLSGAEFTTADSRVDMLSNGFKLRSSTFESGINQFGVTYIYAAFAESPFQYARAR